MYGVAFPRTSEFDDPEWILPIGKAVVERPGTDVTIVAHSLSVQTALDAAQILQESGGISLEVINLRTIKPLDLKTILTSLAKTNRLVTVEGGWASFGVGSEIAAQVMESKAAYIRTLISIVIIGEGFDMLDAPIVRIAGADIPLAYAKNLETLSLPTAQNIVNTIKRMFPNRKIA